MRTLDFDAGVLKMLTKRAEDEGVTIRQIFSRLARKASPVRTPRKRLVKKSMFTYVNGIPTLPSRGEVITYEHVQNLMDEGEY